MYYLSDNLAKRLHYNNLFIDSSNRVCLSGGLKIARDISIELDASAEEAHFRFKFVRSTLSEWLLAYFRGISGDLDVRC